MFRRQDAEQGVRVAQVLEGFISRKVVKQTVMTVVYGVTRYGGRLQIEKRLREIHDFPQVRGAETPDPAGHCPVAGGRWAAGGPDTGSCLCPPWGPPAGSMGASPPPQSVRGHWPRAIRRRGGNLGPAHALPLPSPQDFVWEASHYLVRQVFNSLQEMFSGTRSIQVRPHLPPAPASAVAPQTRPP